MIQLRAAIRKVLTVAGRADPVLAGAVRQVLTRDDDYATLGKPPCDWTTRLPGRRWWMCWSRMPSPCWRLWMATT